MTNLNDPSTGTILARLFWRTPEGEEQQLALEARPVVIGRNPDCDVSVVHARVSRRHAEIRCDGHTFTLLDLGSLNGTFMGGQRLAAPQPLKNGDCFSVGPIPFRFEQIAPSPAPLEQELSARPTFIMPEPVRVPYLEIQTGPQKGARFELVKDRMVAGRADRQHQWDIVLQDRAVSRPQAEIVREPRGPVLTDLNSVNGTLVNGKAISAPYLLRDGDAITLGETVLIFHVGGAG